MFLLTEFAYNSHHGASVSLRDVNVCWILSQAVNKNASMFAFTFRNKANPRETAKVVLRNMAGLFDPDWRLTLSHDSPDGEHQCTDGEIPLVEVQLRLQDGDTPVYAQENLFNAFAKIGETDPVKFMMTFREWDGNTLNLTVRDIGEDSLQQWILYGYHCVGTDVRPIDGIPTEWDVIAQMRNAGRLIPTPSV